MDGVLLAVDEICDNGYELNKDVTNLPLYNEYNIEYNIKIMKLLPIQNLAMIYSHPRFIGSRHDFTADNKYHIFLPIFTTKFS